MKTATVKKKASEIIVIAGMVLLLTYISDAAVGQGETGFLPMNEKERGGFLFFYSLPASLSSIICIFGNASLNGDM